MMASMQEIENELYDKNINFSHVFAKKNEELLKTKIQADCSLFFISEVDSIKYELEILIDKSFPFKIPIIKLNTLEIFKDYRTKYRINPPHINQNGYICFSQRDEDIANHTNQVELIVYSIIQSIKIITDGYYELNKADFVDEFYIHLNNLSNNEKVYMLDNLEDNNFTDRLYLTKMLNYEKSEKYLSTSNIKNEKILKNKYPWIKNEDLMSRRILYLPLNFKISFPLPLTNKEVFDLLKDKDKSSFNKYRDYLKRNEDKDEIIIFSMLDNNSKKMFFGINHKKPLLAGKEKKNGYRFTVSKNDEIEYINIVRIDSGVLESRVQVSHIADMKISIVGCGSIGSILAETLLEIGIEYFILIDDENIGPENIIRHIALLDDIGKTKVSVIKNYILSKKHYADVLELYTDFFNLINKDLVIPLLNKMDINFYATGNGSLNNKIISMINNNELTGTNIIIWVEPFLYGGHCLILNNNIDEDQLIDSNGKFKYRVIENGEKYLKDDVGCSGRFVQYSGFDSKKFIYDLVYYLRSDFNRIKTGNSLITWTGNLLNARKQGVELNNKWVNQAGNNLIEEKL